MHRLLLTTALLCSGVYAQPFNDECSNALPITIDGGTFDNLGATTSSPAWPCGTGRSDVWFRYESGCTGFVTFTTCISGTGFDTTLQVFRGSSCASLVSLGCNDDDPNCNFARRSSTVGIMAEAGATYMVRVGGFLGDTGTFRLHLECSSIIDVGTHGNNTYYLLAPATWHEGQMMARAMGGNLVTIDDQAEQDFLWNRWGQNRNLWTGLHDEGRANEFRWVSGRTALYRNWYPGEPNSINPGEHYVHLARAGTPPGTPRDGAWNDISSDGNAWSGGIYPVVEIEGNGVLQTAVNPANGNTYHLLSADSWQNSENRAQQLGGHLVTLNDRQEHDWVLTTFGAFNGRFRHLWIGLNDAANEGTFVWSSGEPSSFTRWGAGEPNGGTAENYVHIAAWPWIGGLWNDSHGLDPSAFGANVDPQAYGVVEVANPDIYYSQFNSATGHYYHRLVGGWTWTDAEAAAQRLGGHLVTLNDQAEHDFLHTELSAGPNELLWIGLSDALQEGLWQWVTDEPANYFAWAPGEPSGGTNSNYAVSETVAPRGILQPGPWYAVSNNFAALTAIVEIEPTASGQGWGCRDRDGVPLRLNTIGQARPGGDVDIQLIDSVGLTGAAGLFLGTSNRSWSGLDLPLDLQAFNAPGCTMYAGVDYTFTVASLGGTRATIPTSTPNDPLFIGVYIYFQAWSLDGRITSRNQILTSDYLWVHYSP